MRQNAASCATDLMFDLADSACIRAWEDEGWGPAHKRLLTMCVKVDRPGRKKTMNTLEVTIEKHLKKTGSISVREAMDDYGVSGNTLSKVMTNLRRSGMAIHTDMRKHPITGRKYARYIAP